MEPSIIPRQEVADKFSVPSRLLMCYEARGLIRAVRTDAVEGYGPAEIRRLWRILSYQLDLGINLAGVEAILKLPDQLVDVHRRLDSLSPELRESVEAEPEDAHDA